MTPRLLVLALALLAPVAHAHDALDELEVGGETELLVFCAHIGGPSLLAITLDDACRMASRVCGDVTGRPDRCDGRGGPDVPVVA